jgi:hypothetical protein
MLLGFLVTRWLGVVFGWWGGGRPWLGGLVGFLLLDYVLQFI